MALVFVILISFIGWIFTDIFLIIPLQFLSWLSLPNWLGIAVAILLFSWLLDE